MTAPEMFDKLVDAGFNVEVNAEHTYIIVSLNRNLNIIEVDLALDLTVDYNRFSRAGSAVVISI